MRARYFTSGPAVFLGAVVFFLFRFCGVSLEAQTADGELDSGFTPGLGGNAEVLACAMQSDRQILVGGRFTQFNGVVQGGLARLDLEGSVDEQFMTGTGIGGSLSPGYPPFVASIAVLADARILVAGSFSKFNNVPRGSLARLQPDGSLDPSFDPGAGPSGNAFDPGIEVMVPDADGSLWVGGGFDQFSGHATRNVARLTAGGGVDKSFVLGQIDGKVGSLCVLGDGRILIGGNFGYVAQQARPGLALLTTNGTLAPWVLSVPDLKLNSVTALARQPDGRILVAGKATSGGVFGSGSPVLFRLTGDLALDAAFERLTTISWAQFGNGAITVIRAQADATLLVGGYFTKLGNSWRGNFARLLSDGRVDRSFCPGQLADKAVNAFTVDSGGNIVLGGQFGTVNGLPRPTVARLLSNPAAPPRPGSVDTTFESPFSDRSSGIPAIGIQSDGKIVIGGNFDSVGGQTRNSIARLLPDGTHDVSFNPGAGLQITGGFGGSMYPGHVAALSVLPDDRIVVGGDFAFANGLPRRAIAMFEKDGKLVRAFDFIPPMDNIFIDSVEQVVLLTPEKIAFRFQFSETVPRTRQHDDVMIVDTTGRILSRFCWDENFISTQDLLSHLVARNNQLYVSGQIILPGEGERLLRIVRITEKGEYDPSFHIDSDGIRHDFFAGGGGLLGAFDVQPDGKVVAAGCFVKGSGASKTTWGWPVRFLNDGQLDADYGQSKPEIEYHYFDVMKVLPDGRLAGVGVPSPGLQNALFVLKADGTLDQGFRPLPIPIASYITELQPANATQILIGGTFIDIYGVTVPQIARIFTQSPVSPFYLKASQEQTMLRLDLHNGLGHDFNFETSSDLTQWSYWTNAHAAGQVLTLYDTLRAPDEIRFYRARTTP